MTLYSECYRIAEIARNGCNDAYVKSLCSEVADNHEMASVTTDYVYNHMKRIRTKEFRSE